MASIWICSREAMPALVERLGCARLVSLLPENAQPPRPAAVAEADHLRIIVDDVDEPLEGFILPAEEHVEQLVAFLRESPADRPLVIHCLAGVSRSTAAALVALVLDAPGREHEAAALMRSAAPFADPNRRLITVADAFLGRGGALVAALDSMGESEWLKDVRTFNLPRTLNGVVREQA
jgi:predicted protein tyrosine phosphatase